MGDSQGSFWFKICDEIQQQDDGDNAMTKIKPHCQRLKFEDVKKFIEERDKAKDDYCKQNRIKLVRIPYYESNNIKNIIMQILKQENPQRLSLK